MSTVEELEMIRIALGLIWMLAGALVVSFGDDDLPPPAASGAA